jgi:glutathionyl-hydroquinone reductase
MLAVPGIRGTVNIDHIKQGYYSIKALNPNGIVPRGRISARMAYKSFAESEIIAG